MQKYKKHLIFFLITYSIYQLSISAMATTWVIFMAKRNLDVLQIGLVNMIFMAANFLFEIPTGVVADVFGRKKSVVAAFCVRAIAMFIVFASKDIYGFSMGFIVAALGETLFSGAGNAWFVDSMSFYKSPHPNDVLFSKLFFVTNCSTIIGGIVGAYTASANIAYPWLVAGIGLLISAIVAQMFGKEEYFVKKSGLDGIFAKFKDFKEVTSNSIQIALRKKEVFLLICGSTVVMFVVTIPVTYWQPLLLSLKPGRVEVLGWINSFMLAFAMLGNFVINKLSHKIESKQRLLTVSLILNSIFIMLAGSFGNFYLASLFFLGHLFSWGLYTPVNSGFFNDVIPSKERATILSLRSMMESLGASLGLLIGGYIAKVYSISLSWVIMGAILLFAIPFFKLARSEKTSVPLPLTKYEGGNS